jgi:tetratricopeptide (TPR) repeat protein
MRQRLVLLAILLSVVRASARDKPENWIEVRSPHFVVVSNSSEKKVRRVADQFERMRSVFHSLFPKLQLDPGTPIIVLAVKDEKDFRGLEPAAYLAKGQLKLAGLFLLGADKNYVLLRLDVEGEHPYAVVYHEYTHLLFGKVESLPLWLNEGLAEFYENTEVSEKNISVGLPIAENVMMLRQNQLMPLATLFAVDRSSPYYHEEHKGSIFYAESWALTHYLKLKDTNENTQRIGDYLHLLEHGVDSVTAATQAFGDLKQLQAALDEYIRQAGFRYWKHSGATEVDDTAIQVRALDAPKADAVRADFLAYNDRAADARALLDHILEEDPNNVLAHETMGFLEFRVRHIDEARNWYAQAVKLDSQNFLAHYYFAAISMNGPMDAANDAQIESSLRTSIKLNPKFAPSYDRLAAFLATRHKNLDEARLMALNAVELEPGNLNYRMSTANVLLQMRRGGDAVRVIRNAMRLASTPEETSKAEDFLIHAEEFVRVQQESRQFNEQANADASAVEATNKIAVANAVAKSIEHDEVIPAGPHRFVTGMLKNIRCDMPAMEMNVVAADKTLGLHSGNYFKVAFSTLNVTLKRDLNPCADLEGRPAKVEYIDSASNGPAALVAVEIHK